MSRALAHIETVSEIIPIEGCDNISLATILGWKVIVNHHDIHVGDNVVYIKMNDLLF